MRCTVCRILKFPIFAVYVLCEVRIEPVYDADSTQCLMAKGFVLILAICKICFAFKIKCPLWDESCIWPVCIEYISTNDMAMCLPRFCNIFVGRRGQPVCDQYTQKCPQKQQFKLSVPYILVGCTKVSTDSAQV